MRRYGALAVLSLAAASLVEAAQPLATDDAAIVAAKACQVEAWMQRTDDGRGYWIQPACNFTGNLELSAGVARSRPEGDEASSVIQLQAKSVLARSEEAGWSFGILGAAARDTAAAHGRSAFQLYQARALLSWYPQDRFELDVNLGLANAYGVGNYALAGVAVQYTAVENFQLLAETYRDQPGRSKYRAGVRWVVVPDHFDAYAAGGRSFGASSAPWSVIVGIRLQAAALLP